MTTFGLVMLMLGVAALLVRELAVVRLDTVPKRLFGVVEIIAVVAVVMLVPRMVELLT